MKILLVAKTGPPFPNRENIRPWYLGQLLREEGNEVHLLFPYTKNLETKKSGIYLHGIQTGLMRPWWLQKILFSFFGLIKSVELIREYDINWVQGWNFPTTLIAALSAKITGKKSIADMTDFGFDLMRTGKILPGILVSIIQLLETKIIPRLATKIVSVSNFMRDKLIESGVNKNRIIVIEEGIDSDCLKSKIGKKKGNYILYLGNIEYYDGVDIIVKAFKKIKPKFENLKLVIVGGGRKYFKEFKKEHEGEDIIFTGFVQREKVAKYIAAAKLCLVGIRRTLNSDSVVSLKLLEYWALGKPVIAPKLRTMGGLIKQYDAGLLFEPGDAEDLSGKMIKLLNNKRLREKLGKNGKKAVKDFEWTIKFRGFLPIYMEGM